MNSIMRLLLLLIFILLSTALPARAQQTVSLLTFGPGELTFEKFGHTALRIRDVSSGLDVAYNWGIFDFDQPNLIGKFVLGRLEYWMDPFDAPATIAAYQRDGRSVWEQELNLTPQQTRQLITFLVWNMKPANKYYKYDYFRDNCTTRVRDALDAAAGGVIGKTLKGQPASLNMRDHTRALVAGDFPLYTGLQIVLAGWVDQPIDAWQETFLPIELQRHIRSVKTIDEAGNEVPLVRSEVTLLDGKYPISDGTVPTRWPIYLMISVVLGGAMFLLSNPACRRGRLPLVALFVLIFVWSLLAGAGGSIMTFGWGFTDHIVSYRNENLLQMNPLMLVMIPLAFLMLFFQKARRATLRLAQFVAILSIVGLLIKVLPWFGQNNWEIIALSLPVNVGLALAMMRLMRIDAPRSETVPIVP